MNRLAEKIKAARLKAKLTEKELAKKCGLSVGYILQIESGKKIVKEDFAEKILSVLGEKNERLEQELPKEEVKTAVKKTVSKQNESIRNINPTGQWADALAGVIKSFPVTDLKTSKAVDHKDLPILSKKIDGIHADKVMFVKASDDSAKALHVRRGDVVTVAITHEIENGKIYVIEQNGDKQIRLLRKNGEKISLYQSEAGTPVLQVQKNALKVIGKCIKTEHML